VILIDDVVSTGSTLNAMKHVIDKAEGDLIQVAAIFTEGDSDWTEVIALDHLPVYID
jgi:adenine phosphoribosyltransferase